MRSCFSCLLLKHHFLISLSKVLKQPRCPGKMCGYEDLTRLKRKCHKYFFLSRSYRGHQKTSDRLKIKQKKPQAYMQIHKIWGIKGGKNALNNIQSWLSLSSIWKYHWCTSASIRPWFSSNGFGHSWPLICSRLFPSRPTCYSFTWKSKEVQDAFLRDGLCSMSGMF